MLTIEEKAAQALQETYTKLITEKPNSPVCPLCCGQGAVGFSVPLGHPAFGRAFRCPCQDMWAPASDVSSVQSKYDKLFGKDGIPKKIAGITFDSFHSLPVEEFEARKHAIVVCRRLVRDGYLTTKGGATKYGVVFSGEPGKGKSALSVAAARAMAAAGIPTLWRTLDRVVDVIQGTYSRDYKGKSKLELIEILTSVKVLFLDDVGYTSEKDHVSQDERRILYDIMVERHANNRVTVITTNLSPKRFKDEFDPRTFRRVRDLCIWINLKGNDLTPYGQEL